MTTTIESAGERLDSRSSEATTMPPNTRDKRSTWEGWDSRSSWTLTRAELLKNLRDFYKLEVTPEQLERWEDEGFLPPMHGRPYVPAIGFLIRVLAKAERQGLDPDAIRSMLRVVADTLAEDDALDTQDRIADLRQRQETWEAWIPEGWPSPLDEDLITRDVLLDRVKDVSGIQIHPRTLQSMEQQGLVPRPVRRWHDGATRALYAPWVVDLVIRAYYRRNQGDLDQAIAEMRDAVKQAIALYDNEVWGGRTVSEGFLSQLRDFADVQRQRTGLPIPSAEIRFFDAAGNAVATIHQNLTRRN